MKTIDQKALGRHLAAARKAHHLTQRQLEEKANIAKGMVSKYEQGVTLPCLYNLLLICGALGITLDDYIGEIPVVEV